MSSRGVLHGSFATLLVGFAVLVYTVTSPSFLVLRSELEQKQCWMGEGIFTSRAFWGPDLAPHTPCRDVRRHNPGPISTHEAYCHGNSEFDREMCEATNRSRYIAYGLLLFASLSPVLVLGMIWLKRNPKFALNAKLLAWVLYASLGCSVASLVLMVGLAGVMFSSPLFSSQYVATLSKEFNKGLPFTGGFSCAFQTPLHSLFSLASNGPMECVFPGPASCCLVLGMATQALGVGFLLRFLIDMKRVPEGVVMLRGASEAATPRQEQEFLREVSRRRRYSLYGAFRRRYSHMFWPKRVCLLNILPTLGMLSTIATWLTYNLLGIQIIVITQFSIVSNSALKGHYVLELDNATVNGLLSRGEVTSFNEGVFFKDVLNVFNFSPLTSIKYFWLNDAYLLAGAVFVSVFVLPVVRVIAMIWYFFAPARESVRGNVLSTMDWVGKYSLANLYVMSFLAIALTFHSNFIVIPINRHQSFLVNIRSGMNAGNGWGSYMFVLTSVLSLVIGQINIQFHAYASYWEEDRRAAEKINPERCREVRQERERALLSSPVLPPEVIPTLRSMASFSSRSNLAVVDELTATSGAFPRSDDLATTSGAYPRLDESNSHRDLWRALASFGSRTALDVVLPEDRPSNARMDELVPFHPFAEALCDRVFSPIQGVRIKFTPLGKVLSWIAMFTLVGFMLVCQSWDLVEIHQNGLAGDVIVQPKNRYQSYSLVGLTSAVARTGINVPAVELSFLFFVMTAMMPVATAVGLALMWAIPLTLRQQTSLFTWLEIASAWSSLDIFFLSIVCILVELHDVTEKILSDAVPNLSKLIELFLPFEDGVMSAEIRVLDGLWVLLTAVILEKIAIYIITESACQAITERRVEQFLRNFIQQQNDSEASQMNLTQLRELLGDASQGLLESDAILAFAPMGRYTSVTFPRYVYAGFPRSWWAKFGVKLGLMADARTVDYYYKTGRWLQELPVDVEEAQEEHELEQRARFRTSSDAVSPRAGGEDGGWFF
ncbi:hypothetical protein BASA81_006387 [Batrachochytrium salamandrivorans]|nr:hypothetical protein BASA81_006387 [Batrachochytrium salamandrivorans]